MFEDIEGITEVVRQKEAERESLSMAQTEYITECVEGENPSALVDRVDELSPCQPPKGIDADPEVAAIIEPIKDQVDSKYIEAPSDVEQIRQIGDYLSASSDLNYDKWFSMEFEDRCEALRAAEVRIAEIEHRPACELKFKCMEDCHLGYFSQTDKTITINSAYIFSDSQGAYREVLDTLIHEGRHAYQDYNMYEREVHSRPGEVNMWKWNENDVGYQTVELCGFEVYAMQPVETDARAFAEDVLTSYFEKTA